MDINQESLAALLHFDGTNGTTTITDTSKNALGGLCVGTAALSTTQFKYGTASLKTGSANGNYLKLPPHKAYDFGSADFTVESWVWPVSQGTDYGAIFGRWDDSVAANRDWLVWRAADGSVNVSINGAQVVTGAAGDLPTGAFAHVALTRSGTALQVWVGGVAKGSGTLSDAINCTPGQIGALGQSNFTAGSTYLEAYYDDYRMTLGVARYTSGFTPPATAFEDFWNTVLLTHFDTVKGLYSWLDSSRYSRVFTSPSGAIVLAASPSKFGSAISFPSANAAISAPDAPELNPGALDFCLEGWIYPTSVASGTVSIAEKYNASGASAYRILRVANQLQAQISTNGSSYTQNIGPVGTLVANTWYHVALVRYGTTITLYLNGVSQGTAAITAGQTVWTTTGNLYFGGQASAWWFTGNLDEWRMVTGAAVYTSNFTPPSAPFTDTYVPPAARTYANFARMRPAFKLFPTATTSAGAPAQTPSTPVARDVIYGGVGQVAGHTTVNSVAASRRVRLLDAQTGYLVRQKWPAADGAYSFDNVNEKLKYLVVSQDYQQTYNAVVQDQVTPVFTAYPTESYGKFRRKFTQPQTLGLGSNWTVLVKVGEGLSSPNKPDVVVPTTKFPGAKADYTCDFNFTDLSGTNLPYWLERVYGTYPNRTAYFWVCLPGNLDTADQSFYMTYNGVTNPQSATGSQSSGTAAFPLLFDDFPTSPIDSSKWTGYPTQGSIAQTAPDNMTASYANQYREARSVATFGGGYEVIGQVTNSGYANTSAIYTTYFGWVANSGAGNATTAANRICAVQNCGSNVANYSANSFLNINGEADTTTTGAFSPRFQGASATALGGRISVYRDTLGNGGAYLDEVLVATRTGVSQASCQVCAIRDYDGSAGGSAVIDWIAVRKFVLNTPRLVLGQEDYIP